uniref:Sodium/bile acid cotransporter 7-B/bile acid cotransporter 7-B n=1 Tax=Kwoniella dejecticola CBS 10117 TaxID=1296121 RepID=A0A1A6AA66_9TREE|nr:sodium/bile acid cotransporter 7-B/bile acid cotransporter 7-B [Kwoniella dejecticola CBS 10117]OBR86941.1 sodium/bile acid cotransporter 7-B/bile acid cotransporter 7-B [Kwoniella dejecticola CBS 10117]
MSNTLRSPSPPLTTVTGDSKHLDTAQAHTKADAKPRKWYHPVTVLGFLLDNWFLIGIGVSIVLAWRFPNVASDGGVIRSEYSIKYGAISLIFLITGLTLSTSSLYNQIKNWKLHLFTQGFSFLFFPAVVFAIVNIVNAAQDQGESQSQGGKGGGIDQYILAGLIVMGIMPTTVASNITMTRLAGGNVESATIEVCIGNLIGAFITPLLCSAFFSSDTWSFGRPRASDSGGSTADGLREIYKQLAKQLGLAIFVPLFVGQIIQNVFPKQTKYVCNKLRLAKISTFFLLLLIWSVFSTQFENRAFESVSTASIIFLVFLNLGLYAAFTLLCVFLTRLPFLPPTLASQNTLSADRRRSWRKVVHSFRFNKAESTAICFCAVAKGMVVGAPTLSILYGGLPEKQRAILSIPLVLYQGQQVAVAQILVYFFKKWNNKPDKYFDDAPSPASKSQTLPIVNKGGRGSGGSAEIRSEKSRDA